MLDMEEHPVATHDGAVLLEVRACVVIIFFQRHSGVKTAGRSGFRNKEVTQNEMIERVFLLAKGT